MTKYRLPEALGGGEVALVRWQSGHSHATVKVDGVGEVHVPMAALTEVAPPFPPEPRNVSTVRVGARAFVRDDDQDVGSIATWYGPTGPHTWVELCKRALESTGFPPVQMVPESVAEPVELPYRRYDEDTDEYVAITVVDGRVLFGVALASTLVSKIPPAYVTVEDALAILAAHRQLAGTP